MLPCVEEPRAAVFSHEAAVRCSLWQGLQTSGTDHPSGILFDGDIYN